MKKKESTPAPSVQKNQKSNITFWEMPPLALFLFNLLTGFIFEYIWRYHNWNGIKKAAKNDISPFWRSIFFIFYVKAFCNKVVSAAASQSYGKPLNAKSLSRIYIFCYCTRVVISFIIGSFIVQYARYGIEKLIDEHAITILFFATLLLSALTLSIIQWYVIFSLQKAINFYNQKLEKQALQRQSLDSSTIIPYFYVDKWRFIVLNIFSARLYLIYWVYKNWRAIKLAEESKISTFWRAVFYLYFDFSLFRRIYESAKEQGFARSVSTTALATGHILTFLINLFLSTINAFMINKNSIIYGIAFAFTYIIMPILDYVFIRPIQQSTLYYIEKKNPSYSFQNKAITKTEKILMLIGVSILSASLRSFIRLF